jgi:hypothetical protein
MPKPERQASMADTVGDQSKSQRATARGSKAMHHSSSFRTEGQSGWRRPADLWMNT